MPFAHRIDLPMIREVVEVLRSSLFPEQCARPNLNRKSLTDSGLVTCT